MNTPQPLGTDRLTAMLKGAKQVMKKVESGDYSVGIVDPTFLDVNSNQLVEGSSVPQQYHQYGQAPMPVSTNGLPANYGTSRLPQEIKDAMINSPKMPVYNPHHAFDLSDVSPELIEKPMNFNQKKVTPQYQQPMYENYNQQPAQIPNGMMMVNEAQLKEIMKDFMMEFMAKNFAKNLSEDVIKKTIVTLIKEGKITATTKKPASKV